MKRIMDRVSILTIALIFGGSKIMSKQNLKILVLTMLMNICLFGAEAVTAQSNVNGKPNPTPTPAQQTKEAEAKTFFNSGADNFGKKDYDAAIRDFTKVIELEPKYVDAYIKRGTYYAAKKDFDSAIRDYTKAIDIYPKAAEAYINRAMAYETIGKKESAEADRKKAAELLKGN